MMKFPLEERPFPDVSISPEQADEFVRVAETIADKAIEEIDALAKREAAVTEQKNWKPVVTQENVTVYRQTSFERPSTAMGLEEVTEKPSPRVVPVGRIASSLDDIMFGIVSPDVPSIAVKASYVDSGIVDGAVIHKIHGATAADPFSFAGLKWVAIAPQSPTSRPRDILYVEMTGVKTRTDGRRVGVHVTHSVDHPQCPKFPEEQVKRERHSTCYLYCEVSPGTVEVYATGNSDDSVPEAFAVNTTANALKGMLKAAWCAQNKKLGRILNSDETRTRFRSNRGATPSDATTCSACRKHVRAYQRLKSCVLCGVVVCGRCCVQRRLNSANENFELTQRDVQLCKRCIAQVISEDAYRVARAEYVNNDDQLARRRMNGCWCIVGPLDITIGSEDEEGEEGESPTSGPFKEWLELDDGMMDALEEWARQIIPAPFSPLDSADTTEGEESADDQQADDSTKPSSGAERKAEPMAVDEDTGVPLARLVSGSITDVPLFYLLPDDPEDQPKLSLVEAPEEHRKFSLVGVPEDQPLVEVAEEKLSPVEAPEDHPKISMVEEPQDQSSVSLVEDPEGQRTISLVETPEDHSNVSLVEAPEDHPTIAVVEDPEDHPTEAVVETPEDHTAISVVEVPEAHLPNTVQEVPETHPTNCMVEAPETHPTNSVVEVQENPSKISLAEEPEGHPSLSLVDAPEEKLSKVEEPEVHPKLSLVEAPTAVHA